MPEKKESDSPKPGFDIPPPDVPLVIGRSPADVEKFGTKGAILLGKRYIDKDNKIQLDGNMYMDVSGAHVVFIAGKRGGGKSYTMGVIAEGFSLLDKDVRENLSIILLDTMGIYWTMTHPNHKERKLLRPYNLEPKGIPITIFTPKKYYEEYKKQGIPTDRPFSLDPAELNGDDWCNAFRQDKYSAKGILITDTVEELKELKGKFSVDDIIEAVEKNEGAAAEIKGAVKDMFKLANTWGVFSDTPTEINELAQGGKITVLDVSCYATMPGGWDVKALVVGIVAQHLFIQRMQVRKGEEFASIEYLENYFANILAAEKPKKKMPLVWLVIDEAHEFLPVKGETTASKPLITIMREGRQPGICLILATQQPGKIHTDVMTQSDIVLSHRITARMDTDALALLAQSYMQEGITRAMDFLPRVKGAAVVFDDLNEKIHQLRVRPRLTWHGGASPTALDKQT